MSAARGIGPAARDTPPETTIARAERPVKGARPMSVTSADAELHARLAALAAERRRAAGCARCADSPRAPCGACAARRARVAQLNRERTPLAVIAADVALPAWRVARILREQRVGDDAAAERAANARLLYPELGERLVALILNGPPARPGGHPAVRRWHAGVRRLLRARGWSARGVSLVLAGTHVPNAPLRAAVADVPGRPRPDGDERAAGRPRRSALRHRTWTGCWGRAPRRARAAAGSPTAATR